MDVTRIEQNLNVPFSYSVYFTHRVFDCGNSVLKDVCETCESNRVHRILFFVEQGILEHFPSVCDDIEDYCRKYSNSLHNVSKPVILPGGESLKSFDYVSQICLMLDRNGICRQSFACIIGGGAFLDAVGFAAAVVHRGVRQIRIPTTVLAQDDSGVGVKNGINMFNKKNFVGCFAPPFAVINDFDFLVSLEQRDWISGISEAIKVAMIKDRDFFQWLRDNIRALAERRLDCMETMIIRSAELHLEHIRTGGDPFEYGSARPLDFGHWLAHKLEMMTKGRVRHGEAVAIGILVDSHYAMGQGLINEEELLELLSMFRQLGFQLWVQELDITDSAGDPIVLGGIDEFRQHLGGELHITLPNGIGERLEVSELVVADVRAALSWLRAQHQGDL